ncbi:aconitate hydratase AcnA [Terricaulis sp.]|uniref:aconitate hydratase AcnA n=1 Tax=Terricaulis sp. TaxID=2768686 RepID=UPI003784142D
MPSLNSFNARSTLQVGGKSYAYFDLNTAGRNGLGDISKLPMSLKVLLENLLRTEDGVAVKQADILAMTSWLINRGKNEVEIAFSPARVLMQDFTGVPAVVDLAAMRDAAEKLGVDPERINPLVPVDLVIDHSVMVDHFGGPDAFKQNVELEYARNGERYQFLRWGQSAFADFRVVPPGTGICHQVNLEYLGQSVWVRDVEGETYAYPDTVVGTDSHTTMINGIGVLGWGVGGIEAEAAMLGQSISMLIPEVIGFRLTGKLPEGSTATDLVLTVTQMLRKKGVVGKFVEFYGPGLDDLSVADRATIANMAPEYGATCGFFPVDQKTIDYLAATGRNADRVALVEAYCKAQGLWRTAQEPEFTDTLALDLADVKPSLAGPKRPQDRVLLGGIAEGFTKVMTDEFKKGGELKKRVAVGGEPYEVGHGDVVIAAITSCTNTSNPSVMLAAGLVARNARKRGLTVKPWVKTSLAPGSQVVTDYLKRAELDDDLDALGFNLVGYGCTTCIGNSGPLPPAISQAVAESDLVVASVLSGNRNFEGRVNQDVRANYLASPPLVVAYALAGSVYLNMDTTPLGMGTNNEPVYLRDIWPTNEEIEDVVRAAVTQEMFAKRYSDVFQGDTHWRAIKVEGGRTFKWPLGSTYVANPPYFEGMTMEPAPIVDVTNANILALFGDSITTDHISPAGSIKKTSPAGLFLTEHQVPFEEFNSYGARRGNHDVMMRGTFANIRIKNAMVVDEKGAVVEGGFTTYQPSGERMAIYDAAMRYQAEKRDLVVFAGKEYGTGSSRDWAAKGTKLLGVRAVVAESFERIHRSNLIGMGVLPLQFTDGQSWKTLNLTGAETVSIAGVAGLGPRQKVTLKIGRPNGSVEDVSVLCRIDTENEVQYFRNGGILPYVLRGLAKTA